MVEIVTALSVLLVLLVVAGTMFVLFMIAGFISDMLVYERIIPEKRLNNFLDKMLDNYSPTFESNGNVDLVNYELELPFITADNCSRIGFWKRFYIYKNGMVPWWSKGGRRIAKRMKEFNEKRPESKRKDKFRIENF